MVALIVALVIAALVLVVVARSVRIISQARAGIVERLGRFSRTLEPGMHVLLPFVDRLRRPLVGLLRGKRGELLLRRRPAAEPR